MAKHKTTAMDLVRNGVKLFQAKAIETLLFHKLEEVNAKIKGMDVGPEVKQYVEIQILRFLRDLQVRKSIPNSPVISPNQIKVVIINGNVQLDFDEDLLSLLGLKVKLN